MKKFAVGCIFILALSQISFAVDPLDLFRFQRNPEIKLQTNVRFYDPTRSHGIVSPFTGYIGQLVAKLESVKRLKQLSEFELPDLQPGELLVEYLDPDQGVQIQDKVVRRNYVGVKVHFVARRDLETVFRQATDYDHLKMFLPGMQDSKIVDRSANRVDVENWRSADASVFGKRKSYYLTTNIFSTTNDARRKIIKSQLLQGDKKKVRYQGNLYLDGLWYFESCGRDCTRVFHVGFSLLHWDYMRTPPLFPFVAKEVRRKMVEGVVDSSARSVLASLVKLQEPRVSEKTLSRLTETDRKWIHDETEQRLIEAKKEGRIRIDWDSVFS